MKQAIKNLIHKATGYDHVDGQLVDAKEISQDMFAAQQLQSLLVDSCYLPFSTASLRYASLAVFLNDIVVNNRKAIVEFGSGITTYLVAKLILKNRLEGCRLYTVDENREWLNVVQSMLQKEGLDAFVDFIYAPLIETDIALCATKWYDRNIVTSALEGTKIDSVLVDGPSAWYEEVKLSRYPALPFIFPSMNDASALFLDDTNREGEQEIIRLWKQEFNLQQQVFSSSFVGFFKGSFFNIRLFEHEE